MNTAPGISSRQSVYPPSAEAVGKSKETDARKKLMAKECVAGGRSISPAAEEGSVLSTASARHDAGTAGIAEGAGRISLCQEAVQTTQKATSDMASATLINKDGSGRMYLPRELETLALSKVTKAIDHKVNTSQGLQRMMLATIGYAHQLAFAGRLSDAYKYSEQVDQYCQQHPEDQVVSYRSIQYSAYHDYAANVIDHALVFFQNLEMQFKAIDFVERLFVMHLMLGMGVDGKGKNEIFQPDDFYNAIQKWLGANKAENEEIKQSLEKEFGQNAPQVKIFRNGIEAIFKYDDADPKASEARFEQSIDELTKCAEDGTLPEMLVCLVPMLKFAKGLRLIKQGCLDKAMENIGKDQYTGCSCLDQYLACEVERTMGHVDNAIKMCRQGIETGYPFSAYLDMLNELTKGSTTSAILSDPGPDGNNSTYPVD